MCFDRTPVADRACACLPAPSPLSLGVWAAALLCRVMDVQPSSALMLWDEMPTMPAEEMASMRYVQDRTLIISANSKAGLDFLFENLLFASAGWICCLGNGCGLHIAPRFFLPLCGSQRGFSKFSACTPPPPPCPALRQPPALPKPTRALFNLLSYHPSLRDE